MIMQKYIHLLLSLPKSVYINFKVFPFRMAVRLPLLVDYRTVLCGLYKGCFVLDFPTCNAPKTMEYPLNERKTEMIPVSQL